LALSSLFLFYRYRAHRDLHSFPTRRSSDLVPWQPMSVRPRCLHCASPFPATWWPATTRRCELETFADVVRARAGDPAAGLLFERSEEHTSELQSRENLVCRLLLEKKKKNKT